MSKSLRYKIMILVTSTCFGVGAGSAGIPGRAEAGAWTQEPGTAYLRVSGGLLETDSRLDEDGDRVPFDAAGGGTRDTEYRDLAFALYGEVGIARGWTGVASLQYKRVEARQPSAVFRAWGTADMTLGLKAGLFQGTSTVGSASFLITFPTGYDPGEYPALGSDVVDATISLQLGRSGFATWMNLEGFYTHRGGSFRSQVGGSFGGGTGPWRRLSLRGEVRGAAPVGGRASGTDPRFDPALVDPTHVDLAGTLSWQAARGIALEGEVRGTVWGRNTLEAPRVSLAVATSPAWRFTR